MIGIAHYPLKSHESEKQKKGFESDFIFMGFRSATRPPYPFGKSSPIAR